MLFFWACRCCRYTTRKLTGTDDPPDVTWSRDMSVGVITNPDISHGNSAIAVDSDGNSFCGGRTSGSTGIVKFTENGGIEWSVNKAHRGFVGLFFRRNIAVDSNGDVYILGNLATDVAKLSGVDGSDEWTISVPTGTAIALDIGTDDSLYVARNAADGSNLVHKYDTDGNEITSGWPITVTETGDITDIDASAGDIFIGMSAHLKRYASDGTLSYSISLGGTQKVIRGDASGNCYAANISTGSITKRDGSGAEVWSVTGANGFGDLIYSMALRTSGLVVVGRHGVLVNRSAREYDTDGNLIWTLDNNPDETSPEQSGTLTGVACASDDSLRVHGFLVL